jgi:uncharacterized protein (DUF433 family)
MPSMDCIVVEPDTGNGQPTNKGSRITARTILEFLAAGDGIQDVLACIRFSSEGLQLR